MLTIKYLWLIVLLSGVGGFGAAYVALPSDHDLGQQLLEARAEIVRLKKTCGPSLERAQIKKGRGDSF